MLTSNLGSQALSQLPDGTDAAQAKRDVMDAVRAHFRPEFLNRLDDQIVFDRLSRGDMDGIVKIQLARLQKRLADRKISLELDEAAMAWLADEGYDPVFGARPLKRVIQLRVCRTRWPEMLLAGRGHGRRHGARDGRCRWAESWETGSRQATGPRPDDAVVH